MLGFDQKSSAFFSLLIILLITILLAGCVRSYRLEIQQGNVFSDSQIKAIEIGKTRNEVQFILGTPLIEDPFHAERWDYYYSLDISKNKPETTNRISIWFENGRVSRLEVGPDKLSTTTEPKIDKGKIKFFSKFFGPVLPKKN